MITTLTEILSHMNTNPLVFYVYLDRFVSQDDMKRLSERNIKTIYKLATSDIREVRKILRRKKRSFPTILLYLHPEKKVRRYQENLDQKPA